MSLQYTSANFNWYTNDERALWLPCIAEALEERMFYLFEKFGIDGFERKIDALYFTNAGLTEWVRRYWRPRFQDYEFIDRYMGFGGERMYLALPPEALHHLMI